MRYTTARFGETTRLLGRFTSGRALGEVTMTLIELASGSPVSLIDANCVEIAASAVGGFSVYSWPTSNIFTQPTDQTEFLYMMTDTLTGYTREGKIVLGGFPDFIAISLYEKQVHISANGAPLPTIATMTGGPTLVFVAGTPGKIKRGTGSWVADGFKVGQPIQVSGTVLNDGVPTPITGISTTTNPNDTLEFATYTIFNETIAGATVVAKQYVFPAGTDQAPVNTTRDARQIADELGFHQYHIHDGVSLTVDHPHDDWVFLGNDPDEDSLTFVAGSSIEGTRIENIKVFGALNGRITAKDVIFDGVTGLRGVLQKDCSLAGTIQPAPGEIVADKLSSRSALFTVIDFSAGGVTFFAGSVQGAFLIQNLTAGDTLGFSMAGTILQLHSSCTGGVAQGIGHGEFLYTQSQLLTVTIIDQVIRGSDLITSRKHVTNRRKIDTSTNPWRERVYDDNGTNVIQNANLLDTAGAAINNANHPSGVIVGERVP